MPKHTSVTAKRFTSSTDALGSRPIRRSVLLPGLTYLLACTASVLLPSTASAEQWFWYDTFEGNWSHVGNWWDGDSDNTVPYSSDDTSLLFWSGGYNTTHDLGNLVLNKIEASGVSIFASEIDVDKLTFSGEGATISGNVNIWTGITLNSNLTTQGESIFLLGNGIDEIGGSGGLIVASGTTNLGLATYSGATVVASGATLSAFGGLSGNSAHTVDGTLLLNDGWHTIGSLAGSGQVDIGSFGALTVGGDNTSTTFSGTIVGDNEGRLEKVGTGTLTLTGSSNIDEVIVSGGTLLVHGTLTSSGYDIEIRGGTTLGGTGTVDGYVRVQNGGTLAPGASTGTITVSAGVALEAGAQLVFEIDANGDHDLLITGLLLLEGDASLFVVAQDGAPTGDYNLIDGLIELNGYTLSVYLNGDLVDPSLWNGGTGVFSFTAIPEPSTYALVAGAGLAGLLVLRRRRQ